MKHELTVELTTPTGFPRLVSCLHAAAVQVEQLQLEGTRCRVVASGLISEDRLLGVLRRLVDVRAAEAVERPRPRSIVVRQPSCRSTTPHPWAAVCSS